MTITLAHGAKRLSHKRVMSSICRHSHLGAMDVLCTDKTGTLTEARIALVGMSMRRTRQRTGGDLAG